MRAFRKNSIKIEDVFKNSIKKVEKDNNDVIDFEEFKELMLRVERLYLRKH